jgi:formylglycine-generating enzyme required for sulfatase activity
MRALLFLPLALTLHAEQPLPKRVIPVPPAVRDDFSRHEKVALLVGVGAYPASTGLGRLQFSATADISGLETELRNQHYYVVALRDSEAKRPAIREKLRDLSALVKADGGTILFYFSGHGGAGSDGANYLAAYETPSSQLAEEGFAVAEVERLLRESRAQRQIMLIDACRNVPPQPGVNKAPAPSPRFAAIGLGAGIEALFSTAPGGTSYEDPSLGHGVFTHFVIKALKGEAAGPEGAVTFDDLKRYVQTAVRDHGSRTRNIQIPYAKGDSTGEILVALTKAPEPVTPQPTVDAATESWNQIKNSQNPEDFDQFAALFPTSPLAASAKLRAASLRRAAPGPSTTPPPPADTHEPKVNPKDGLTYVWIPPGTFQMGCSPGVTECYPDEKPAKQVRIANGFWMGETAVTQAAYQHVTGKSPSRFKGPRLPVEQVDWNEAKSYCSAIGGRLPTEAEWEYAARAGTSGETYGNVDDIAWYDKNSGNTTHPVGQKKPNAYGLFDMLGNVWQWTADSYGSTAKWLRGGSWDYLPVDVRVSLRYWNGPEVRYINVGFRCVGD